MTQVASKKVRTASVQWMATGLPSFEEFDNLATYAVETARGFGADFVLFPEFFTVPLLAQKEYRGLGSREGIVALARLEERVFSLFARLSERSGVTIVAGSHPILRGETILNVCPIFLPDGRRYLQPKLHITPSEIDAWGIAGGRSLDVVRTPKATIGALICYDSEFPETARHLAERGVEVLFVPYCTDSREGHFRVRYCCQARAIENQIYVVTAGLVGTLRGVAGLDVHYGQSGVYTPSDYEFAREAIQAQADPNVDTILVAELDLDALTRNRNEGSVRPSRDRRPELFDFRATLDEETR